MFDINFCLKKEAEYYAKAETASDQKLRDAYKAVAREFAFRARRLRLEGEKTH